MKVKIKKSVLSQAVKKLLKQNNLRKLQPQFTQQEKNDIRYHVRQVQAYLGKIINGQDQIGNVKWQIQKLQQLFDVANNRRNDKCQEEQQYATL